MDIMGDYSAFIWPAYGVSALMMVWLLWDSVRELMKAESTLKELDQSSAAPYHYKSPLREES